jgi:hypothetical protein
MNWGFLKGTFVEVFKQCEISGSDGPQTGCTPIPVTPPARIAKTPCNGISSRLDRMPAGFHALVFTRERDR